MRIRIAVMRIRILLFKLMRIWILLFVRVMRICDHWYTEPPRLHLEPPWAFTPPLWAATALNGTLFEHLKFLNFYFNSDPDQAFHFNVDSDPASQTNADPLGSGSATLLVTYSKLFKLGKKFYYKEIRNVKILSSMLWQCPDPDPILR